jgi:hypothetical protein
VSGAPTPQPLIDRILHCVRGFSDLDTTFEDWMVTEGEQVALRSLLEKGPALSVELFIMTVEAYIKARETTETQERLFRFQEMKDALRRVRFERNRALEAAKVSEKEVTVMEAPGYVSVPTIPIGDQAASDAMHEAMRNEATTDDLAKTQRSVFEDGPASKCQTCGKPLPVHGVYFMPCTTCPNEPRPVRVLEELAAAIADRDLPQGESRYALWPESERQMYQGMARAVLNHLSPLRAAWFDAFGLVVCRNRSKSDQAKVARFWTLMNQLTGLTKPEVPAPDGGWIDAALTKPPIGPAPNGQPCNSGWSRWVLCCNVTSPFGLDDLGSKLFTAAYSWELNRWHLVGNKVCDVTHWRDDIAAPTP